MKKTLCVLSAALVLLTVGTACGKKRQTENKTDVSQTEEVTWVEFITEKDKKAIKMLINENEYELNIVDESGNAEKTEHYKNDKLTYYYVYSAPDKDGKVNQEYYGADGKLFAVYGAKGFFDANGKEIREDEMQKLIDSKNK